MAAIWFGKLTWDGGIRKGLVEVIGPCGLREGFCLAGCRESGQVFAGRPGDRLLHRTGGSSAAVFVSVQAFSC
jgi:hypothetical protein